MASTIYNFFDFLEKKKGKSLSPDRKARLKMQYLGQKSLDSKDISSLTLSEKLAHFPETLSKEELTVKELVTLPQGTTKIPEGLTVLAPGSLYVPDSISTASDKVTVDRVNWKASSDYYPKSFTGATFEVFTAEGELVTKLPQNIKSDKITLYGTKVTELPENLQVNTLSMDTPIKTIPSSIKVTETIELRSAPENYPKELEGKIFVNLVRLSAVKNREALPEVKLGVGKKVKKGKGKIVAIDKILDLADLEKATSEYKLKDRLKSEQQYLNKIGELFDITWEQVGGFIVEGGYGYRDSFEIVATGKYKDGSPVMIRTEDAIYSEKGQASIKKVNAWGGVTAPTVIQSLLSKLFPDTAGASTEKVKTMRNLLKQEELYPVQWKIGRKTRGIGKGIQGDAKDLIKTLSPEAQNNLARLERDRNVTWKKMIAFMNNDAVNYIIHGVTPEGENMYFDRTGYGMGGSSKAYTDQMYQDNSEKK